MSKATAGDEIFFYLKGDPKSGRVICSGKTGCIVDHEGKKIKLKWKHVAGTKRRVPQTYRVIDQGEDGLIIENQKGRRKYLGIPPEARGEKLKLTPKEVHGVHK